MAGFTPLLLVALSSCTSAPVTPPAVTVTVEAPAPSAAPSAETGTEAVVASPSPAPTAAADAPAQVEVFTMPAVVGMNLQLAQDTLQALDSYLMDQQDASGLGRVQINDSNWQVCAQDPAPGAVVEIATLVTLAAVKLDETCP